MKLLFKLILLWLGGTVFFACQTQHNIVGKYTIVQRGKYPKIIPLTLNVTLNSDSTFDYHYRGGFQGEVSSGIWSVGQRQNSIILSSFVQNMQDVPMIVTETKNDKCVSSVFVFNNPLKSDTLTKWELNINGIDYPMNKDTLLLNNDFVVDNFYMRGFHSIKDSTWIIPIPLQDTIQSKTYYVKDKNKNVYHIAFQPFVNYDIFHYKPIQDVFTLKNNTILFNGIKLRKKE
jgi:hypothetical protein